MGHFTKLAVVLVLIIIVASSAVPTGDSAYYDYEEEVSVGDRTAETDTNCTDCRCGLSNSWMRIVGGWVTRVSEYPWMAALTKKGRVFCGGSLISRQYVLTAAHCLVRSNGSTEWVKDQVKVALSAHNIATMEGTELLSITQVTVHNKFSRSTFDHDIALLKLNKKVQFHSGLRAVCLPPPGDNEYAGQTGTVAGWGATAEGGQASTYLMEARVPIMSLKECRSRGYPASRITDNMICAGDYNGLDSCQGDSGGPLFLSTLSDRMIVIGIVSWGEGCARPKKPGVYTSVSKHIHWILKQTQNECYCT